MRFIGVLGMLVLLGLAWAMSYHRREVKLRIVFWGLGLQFLFAVIILRQDYWSFIGMGVLGLLVAAFIMSHDRANLERGIGALALMLAGACAIGVVLGSLRSSVAGMTAIAIIVLLFLNSRFRLAPRLQAPLGVLLVVATIAWLVAADLHGQIIFSALSDKVTAFLDLSDYGARFLFGNLADRQYFFPKFIKGTDQQRGKRCFADTTFTADC